MKFKKKPLVRAIIATLVIGAVALIGVSLSDDVTSRPKSWVAMHLTPPGVWNYLNFYYTRPH